MGVYVYIYVCDEKYNIHERQLCCYYSYKNELVR